MIAINILMLLLLISFSLRVLLQEQQKSCVCTLRAAPASGPALGEQSHPQGCPKCPCSQSQTRCLCFVTRHQHFHSISSKAGPPPEPAGRTRRGLMNISKMQLESSPSIKNIYSLSYNTARKLWPKRKTAGEAVRG